VTHIPTCVQFELTYTCNNACGFCYNIFQKVTSATIPLCQAQQVLKHLAADGVLSVNLNGGEPLLHPEFFALCEYARALGLALHVNTNATLINREKAGRMADYFDAVCTTVLSAPGGPHDWVTGRPGALSETERGIAALVEAGVYVAANITLCRVNVGQLQQTLQYLRSCGVETVLITRVIPPPGRAREFAISQEAFFAAIRVLCDFQASPRAFARVAFPQPYPPCSLPDDLRSFVAEHNIACTIGRNTARITPTGAVTPCTLVSRPILGNAAEEAFEHIWQRFEADQFATSCMPSLACSACCYLPKCGGGCFGARAVTLFQEERR